MRTTIDMDDELLKEVMEKPGAKSKKNAIVTAMKDQKHKNENGSFIN